MVFSARASTGKLVPVQLIPRVTNTACSKTPFAFSFLRFKVMVLEFCFSVYAYSPGTPVFPSSQKPTFPNSNSILECMATFKRVIWAPWCSAGKQVYITFHRRRRGRGRGGWSPPKRKFGGGSAPHVSVPKISVTRQKIGLLKYSG